MKATTNISLLICLLILYIPQTEAQSLIKIEHLQNKPIVMGQLNGRKAYFLLDTGSDLTLLHEGKADYYDFRIKRMANPHKISGAGGSIGYIHRAGNIDLILGTLPVTTAYFTYDLSDIITSIYRKTFIRISGIIGSDVMIKYGFVIDYGQKEVHFDETLAAAVVPVIRKE
jgi:hypothetical protein